MAAKVGRFPFDASAPPPRRSSAAARIAATWILSAALLLAATNTVLVDPVEGRASILLRRRPPRRYGPTGEDRRSSVLSSRAARPRRPASSVEAAAFFLTESSTARAVPRGGGQLPSSSEEEEKEDRRKRGTEGDASREDEDDEDEDDDDAVKSAVENYVAGVEMEDERIRREKREEEEEGEEEGENEAEDEEEGDDGASPEEGDEAREGGRRHGDGDGGPSKRSPRPSPPSSDDEGGGGPAVAAIERRRRRRRPHRKKGNALGDPDGNSSDDDSDSDSDSDVLSESELEELLRERLEEEKQEEAEAEATVVEVSVDLSADARGEEEEEGEEGDNAPASSEAVEPRDDDDDESDPADAPREEEETPTQRRSGRRGRHHRRPRIAGLKDRLKLPSGPHPTSRTTSSSSSPPKDVLDEAVLRAFSEHVYLPPSSAALRQLREGARETELAGRRRLDRRTLYSGLLLELSGAAGGVGKELKKDDTGAAATTKNREGSKRRYLDLELSRTLRNALSLASQPRWRNHLNLAPRSETSSSNPSEEEEENDAAGRATTATKLWYRSGVRLYLTDDELELEVEGNGGGGRQGGGSARTTGGMWGMGGQGSMGGGNADRQEEEEEEDGKGKDADVWPSTMGMQETVATALAHSLSCGLALLDDASIASVRRSLLDDPDLGLTGDSPEARPAALLDRLIRLANEGRFRRSVGATSREDEEGGNEDGGERSEAATEDVAKEGPTPPPPRGSGLISRRMERDMDLGLDDPSDDLALESLKRMREDEEAWFDEEEDGGAEDGRDDDEDDGRRPLPLVLFLRTDASPSLLRSRSVTERLARECVSAESIHLLMLGRGIDASTASLPPTTTAAAGTAERAVQRYRPRQAGNVPFLGMMPQNDATTPGLPNAFAGMSDAPPGSNDGADGGFSQQNANASGANDPEGSRRFNIFLARTVDEGGNPGIAGAIAPPEAGNLFPRMMAMQARRDVERMRRQSGEEEEDADDEEKREEMQMQMERWEEMVRQQMELQGAGPSMPAADAGGDVPAPQFFNATITPPPGMGVFPPAIGMFPPPDGGGGGGGPFGGDGSASSSQAPPPPPPPEVVQRAIRDAMNGVIDRLAKMDVPPPDDGGSSSPPGNLPPDLARAFARVLSNENLRRGIAENLARAAPALVDPRCQGVMLSVYVPPGPDHPNRGMMPGQGRPRRGGQQQQQQQQAQQQKQRQPPSPPQQQRGGSVGGWLNKILSHSAPSGGVADDDDEEEEEEDEIVGRDAEGDEGRAEDEEELEDDDDASSLASEEEGDRPTSSSGPSDDASSTADDADAAPSPSKKSKKDRKSSSSSSSRRGGGDRKDRTRALAAAAAVLGASSKDDAGDGKTESVPAPSPLPPPTPEQRAARNLSRLQSLCRPVPLDPPTDPVRSRSWNAWSARERGAVVFRTNRDLLNAELRHRRLRLKVDGGTKGAGSALRRMMSVRDVSGEMEDVVRCAVEIEAGRSQRHQESPWRDGPESGGRPPSSIDESLRQLLPPAPSPEGGEEDEGDGAPEKGTCAVPIRSVHPSSLESALSLTCRLSPSPASSAGPTSALGPSSSGVGGGTATPASHRSREDILALAKDKHERALVSQVASPQDIGVTYDMIGGLGDVKELLRQSITYPLKFPHLYSEGIAREAVKGVLLFGPPGTGKTMLAKAVATEGGASFLSVDASSVENKWLGESEKNAKAVFTLARRLAPCVVFIDEVDSLLSSREGSSDDSAHGTLTSVKTTMMSEWDGLNSGTNGRGEAGSDRVIVIGSTNRPFDLDEAVLRRFPRRILVDLPDAETRREILEVTMAENRLDPGVNLTQIAERLEGYTGSDIKEVCREAVVQISHEQARLLDQGYLAEEDEDDLELSSSNSDGSGSGGGVGGLQRLRPVTMDDFDSALKKLKKSVSEKGRELARVWEWNDEYGEIKKKDKRDHLPHLMNMFL